MTRVLLVDDDASMCELLQLRLGGRGMEVVARPGADEALATIGTEPFDVVITDLSMTGMNGLQLCERLVANNPELPVIVITGHTSLENAVAALRVGACDFITKPIDFDALTFAVERAVTRRKVSEEVRRLPSGAPPPRFESLVGESPVMVRLFELLARVADLDASVLLSGESGTGKDLIARALHDRSRRAGRPFVAINCAAMPEALLESELFGHVKGAFTDAKTDHPGLFQQASDGTLFLDEIGEMPLRLQPKLLRALQERSVRAVGGGKEVRCDVRIIAATNQDLDRMVEEGKFREDLFYRLNVIHVQVPPLRARGADMLLLARHFLQRYAAQLKKPVTGISAAAAEKLMAYAWPGNTRELQNCIERGVALTNCEQLIVDDLPERVRDYRASEVVLAAGEATDLTALEIVERRHMQRVLSAGGGNKTLAAKILRVNRRTLARKFGPNEGHSDPEHG